ncbi:hypothetical protein MtrunA17_Chr7g0226091 [Medicago truncatula]|uniref:Uncharacterized protein n=1 Tax=Medicago truncatula TaxID=3880 RepID=A0A396H033_MEDTR|nr:hypothetical protein MtrunA17_Chr7g0226091 [Medicago truncatula]
MIRQNKVKIILKGLIDFLNLLFEIQKPTKYCALVHIVLIITKGLAQVSVNT